MNNKINEDFSFEWEERANHVPVGVHMLAGSIAGISEHTLLLPLDNLKTHLQTKSASLSIAYNEIKSKGIGSFYRGSAIIALGCIPSHALFFMNYEYMLKRFARKDNELDIVGNMLVGGSATVFHDLIMTPCELIKQRSQLLKHQSYSSIINQTYKKEGFSSFWRSYPINFVGNVPNGMIFVSANENLKNSYRKNWGELKMWSYFLCASLSGVISAVFTTPLDNIKTRLNVQQVHIESIIRHKEVKLNAYRSESQGMLRERFVGYWQTLRREFRTEDLKKNQCNKCIESGFEQKNNSFIKYPNAFCSMKIIMKEEGAKGFFKGTSMRIGTQSMSSAISWCVYEYTKRVLTGDVHKY